MSTPETAVRELTYGEAVREAIAEEMRRDARVFLIGEDVAEAGHPFKVLTGLVGRTLPGTSTLAAGTPDAVQAAAALFVAAPTHS